ncbi:MAG: trimeric intracellular cation channel family protein [Campylobacterales bacterium]
MSIDLFLVADIIGVCAFTISGFLVGVRKNLDILGVLIASIMTALGGGIIRDTLALRVPFAFDYSYPALTVIITISLALIFKLHKKGEVQSKRRFIIADAIGLVSFSITGAIVAIESGFNLFGTVLLSFITAIGGGMIRDIMINEVPFVLKSEFYGSISILVGLSIYMLHHFMFLDEINTMLVAIFFLFMRLFAYFKGLKLPRLNP